MLTPRHAKMFAQPVLWSRTLAVSSIAGSALLLGACAVGQGANNPLATGAVGPSATTKAQSRGDGVEVAALPLPGESQRAAEKQLAPGRGEPMAVTVLLPLSGAGQTTLIADAMRKAAEMAASDLGAGAIVLTVRDDKGTPEGADAAIKETFAGQKPEVVLGPLFSKSVAAVAPQARAQNVPVLAFSNDRQVAGQGAHLVSVMPGPDVARVVEYAISKGKKRFAALIPDDPAGRAQAAQFRDAVTKAGGTIVAAELYPVGQPNAVIEPVRKLRDQVRGIEDHGDPVDALFLPGGEDTLPLIAPHLRQAGFDPQKTKIIGSGSMEFASAGRDPLLVGAWFAAPDPRDFQTFAEKFARIHGHAPPRIAALAYDAVAVLASLSNGPKGTRITSDTLSRAQGFSGAEGSFRLLPDGTTERALAVLEVGKMGHTVVEAAPRGFGAQRTSVADAGRVN
jgi:branched-chain amino acid transport system substrate-binding protein